jgi:glucose-1-phosphate adenylyltransferase
MVAYHMKRQADRPVGCVAVPPDRSSDFGIVSANADGRIEGFVERPESSATLPDDSTKVLDSMDIYMFSRQFLEQALIRDAPDTNSGRNFGKDVIPRLVAEGGCRIRRAVIDKRTCVVPGTVIGEDLEADRKRFDVTERGIVLVTPAMLGPSYDYVPPAVPIC